MARINKPAGDSAADQQLIEQMSAASGGDATPDLKLAAEKRTAAAAERDPAAKREQLIDALLAERRGYVSRVAQVDKQLAAYGQDSQD